MYCGQGTLVKYGGPAALAVTLRCKSWGCELCRPRRQKQLMKLAADGYPDKFITLTCKPGVEATPAAAAHRLADAWRRIVKRIKRRWPNNQVQYLAVFEAHQSGWPHLHILARAQYIPQKWLSAVCKELLDSPIVDIRAVKNRSMAAYYVAKYVGKAPGHFETCKRYWCTAKWRKRKDRQTHWINVFYGIWVRSEHGVWRWADTLEKLGYETCWEGEGRLRGWRRTESASPPTQLSSSPVER